MNKAGENVKGGGGKGVRKHELNSRRCHKKMMNEVFAYRHWGRGRGRGRHRKVTQEIEEITRPAAAHCRRRRRGWSREESAPD